MYEGNVQIAIEEKQVRVWVCNTEGENIFRLKAMGKVVKSGKDVVVISDDDIFINIINTVAGDKKGQEVEQDG